MIKKHIRLTFLALIVFFVLTPYVIGLILQHQYTKTLNLISQNMKVNLKLLQYKRGWFHSQAILAANFPLADKPLDIHNISKDNALIIKQRIYQGPIIFYRTPAHSSFKFALTYIDSFFDEGHHFAQTSIALNTHLSTHLSLKDYTVSKGHSVLYSLNGLQGEVKVSANRRKFHANLQLDHLIANVDTAREVTDFTTQQHLVQDKFGLWTGQKKYHFGTLLLQQGEKIMLLKTFDSAINSQLSNGKIQTQITSKVGTALINHINYGQQQVAVSLVKLDSEEFKLLQHYFPMASTQSPLGEASHLQLHFNALLTKGTDLHINTLALNTAWGKININADILCPCRKGSYHFSTLLSSAHGNIKGRFPIELANILLTHYYLLQQTQTNPELAKKSVQESFANWKKMGWLKTLGNDYLINIKWQNNHLLPLQ